MVKSLSLPFVTLDTKIDFHLPGYTADIGIDWDLTVWT